MYDKKENEIDQSAAQPAADEAVQRGRAAIEAEKVASGEAATPASDQAEKKDAEQWRNEG